MQYRSTIKKSISCKGVGVHSGLPCRLTFKPATCGQGIGYVFSQTLKASWKNISRTAFSTELSHEKGPSISMTEHMLAACYGLGLTDLVVEVDGHEAPILDGSAQEYANLLKEGGRIDFSEKTSWIVLHKPIEVREGDRFIRLIPIKDGDVPWFSSTIQVSQEVTHRHTFNVLKDDFCQEIAPARSFARLEDVQAMQKAGYIKGASLKTGLVFHQGRPINEGGMRLSDECARHKILDMMGDFCLLGHFLWAHVEGFNSGHGLNKKAMEALMTDEKAFSVVSFGQWANAKPFWTDMGFLSQNLTESQGVL